MNILINCKDLLRLRPETLHVTLKFTCPFGVTFYLADSLLIPLQPLSVWTRNITVKANPPLTPYSPFSFHLLNMSALSCDAKLPPWNISWNPVSYHDHQRYSLHPENNPTPIKLWACDQPLDLPKPLGSMFVKVSESSACHRVEEPSASNQQKPGHVSACRRELAEGKNTIFFKAFSVSGSSSSSDRH